MDEGSVRTVILILDDTLLVNCVQEIAVSIRDFQTYLHEHVLEKLLDSAQKVLYTLPCSRADSNRIRLTGSQLAPLLRILGEVNLVPGDDNRLMRDTEVFQDLLHSLHLRFCLFMRYVNYMYQDIRFLYLFQRRTKRRDEIVGESLYKPDSVGEQGFTPLGKVDTAGRRIERGEKLVLCDDRGVAERIEQGTFAGIRVAHNRNHRNTTALTPASMLLAVRAHFFDFAFKFGYLATDFAAVDLDLCFTRTTEANTTGIAAGTPAGLTRKVRPHACQPRQPVLQLCKFNL